MAMVKGILRKEHEAIGLKLSEEVDFLYLKRNGKVVAVYHASSAKFEEILKDADNALEWTKSGIEVEK